MEQLTFYLKLHTGTLSVYLFIHLFSPELSLLIQGSFAQMTTTSLTSELCFRFWNPDPAPPPLLLSLVIYAWNQALSDSAGERQPGPKTPVVWIEGDTGSGVYVQMGRWTGRDAGEEDGAPGKPTTGWSSMASAHLKGFPNPPARTGSLLQSLAPRWTPAIQSC